MGFFSNLKKKARKSIRTGVAPVMPRRGGLLGGMPQTKPLITDMRFRGRMPQKFTGLSGLFRRLQEQLRNQQMRAPQPIPERMPVPPAPTPASSFMPEGMTEDFAKRVADAGIDLSDTASYLYSPAGFNRGQSLIPMPKAVGPNPDYVPPAVAPDMIPNLDLGMPVMPEERMAPPLMNQMEGDPRMMMAAGGPLMGRAANISRQVLRDKRGTNKFFPDRFGNVPPISDRILGSPGRGQPGGLTYGARDLNRIRNTEDAIMAGGGLGVAGMIDATNMFSEPASMDNISFMSPEAMGTDLANLRVGIDKVIDLAKNKASEMGADINEYVDRTRSAYDQQMENQRMQELDAQQGMQPFSMLMGPDMPLFRPEETDPRVNRMIESGRGRTVSDMDRESLDDILSDLEKKN